MSRTAAAGGTGQISRREPMALAAVAALIYGVETRKRRLEEITAAQLHHAAPAGVPVP